MGVNQNSISPGLLRKAFEGLKGDPKAVIDTLPGVSKFNVTDSSGTVTLLPTASTLAQDLDDGIAELATPREFDQELGSVDYSVRRFVGLGSIADGVEVDARGKGLNMLQQSARMAESIVGLKLNKKLDTVLRDVSVNEAQAVTSGVHTLDTSDPILDLQKAFAKCGYGDTLLVGRDIVEAWQRHPAFTSASKNFDAGAVGTATILELLREEFASLANVVMLGNVHMYNSANPGLTKVLAYQFDGLLWVGHARNLAFFEQKTGNEEASWREETAECRKIRKTRRADIRRADKNAGCVITGVI